MNTALSSADIAPCHRLVPARVLVVDDADSCRAIFTAVLSKSGYAVETAVNGADGLQRLAASRFDLVLTDWEMPVLDGGGLVLALRSAGIQIPVIMISGAFAGASLPGAIALEVFAALEKPVRPVALLAAVTAALSGGRPALSAA